LKFYDKKKFFPGILYEHSRSGLPNHAHLVFCAAMDWGVQHLVTPQGDVLVVMPLAQFQRMSAAAGCQIQDQPVHFEPAHLEPAEVRIAVESGASPLAAWRKFRDVSQTELARQAGVSRFTVMRIEASGAGAGNRQSRKLLAGALGIPVAAI
jgi:hypothetical protein